MRRALYLMHLYCGLFAGLLVAFVGATGSAVVYRPEIERLPHPEWFRVQPSAERRTLDELAARAVATYPGGKPTFVAVHPPRDSDDALLASGPWARG